MSLKRGGKWLPIHRIDVGKCRASGTGREDSSQVRHCGEPAMKLRSILALKSEAIQAVSAVGFWIASLRLK
ncbi:hypothetical protein [Bradyrhizobium sp. CCBAU 53338]|uniref:hypothetical protein n=1 Tax=Bradyrhizobium sp. CCBAU 53338 TaxID=1325111 RepID=UPI00188A4261|nr:hypothetical protein [Bradyrhizobium sp. CCBAU 53338]